MELRLELALSSSFGEEEEDQGNNHKRCFDEALLGVSNRNGEALVGWPPVKSWRKEFSRHNDNRRCVANYVNVENGGRGRGANSTYVKVKMEGVGIGRKVDLSIHNSYQSLTAHLVALFGKCEEDAEKYEVMYQDEGGGCRIAGDVPWETFVRSVQRMKLQRNRQRF